MQRRKHSPSSPWYLYVFAAAAAAMIALGITQIGPPTSSARVSREVEEAENGVVQSSVSGTGNVEAATDETVNFATSGTLQSVYVSVGEHVHKGQLLATLDPSSAELSLKEAKASLAAAKDNLKAAEDGTSSSSGDSDATSLDDVSDTTDFVDYTSAKTSTSTTPTTTTTTTTPTTTTTTPTTTTPTKPKSKSKPGKGATKPGSSTTGSTTGTTGVGTTGTGSTGTGSTGSTGSGTTTTSASEIASAKASVDSAKANVDSAEQEVADTKLYAPVSGTIASLESVSPGQSISGTSSSNSSDDDSSSDQGSSSTGSSGAETAGSLGSSSSSSSSSSSGFAEIVNSGTLTMTVALSESDISSVKVGQAATVSMDALSGVELGAHVTSISPLATTSDDVVSYDVTLTLDQTNAKVRPGMSASATIITAQAQGVTVPNDAITGTGSNGSVRVQANGKTVTKQVVVGLRGSSRSVILSGLRAGQDVVVTITLPALGTTSTTSSSSSTGTLGTSGFGARTFGGGGFPGGGFPGGGFAGGG